MDDYIRANPPRGEGARHRGPSLSMLAVIATVLFAASIAVAAVMADGVPFPSPFAPASLAADYFAKHAGAVRLQAFLQFGAVIPFAIFTATVSSRLRFLGVNAAGPIIALVGGVLASAMAALSGLAQWTLAQPGVATSEGVMRAFHMLSFATGGPGYVVPFGLLIAGVSLSGGLTRNLPRWIMWFGLVLAAMAELSFLSLVIPAAAYLLPAVRFPGFVWLIAVGVTLPVSKRRPFRASQT